MFLASGLYYQLVFTQGSHYRQLTLQTFLRVTAKGINVHEEGRIRYTPIVGVTPGKLSCDYFPKDHLGNTRMALTEYQQTDMYTPYQFAGNEVPNAIDLDGLEPYRYTDPKQLFYQGAGDLSLSLGKLADNMRHFVNIVAEAVSANSSAKGTSNVNSTEIKAGIGTNVSEFLCYVKDNGSAKGYMGDAFIVDWSWENKSGVRTEGAAGGYQVTNTTYSDGSKETEMQVPNPMNPATEFCFSNWQDSEGNNTIKAQYGNVGPLNAKVGIQYDPKNQQAAVVVTAEAKSEHKKLSISFGIGSTSAK